MRNLESFGVQELSAKEIRETDGGWVVTALRIIARVAASIAAINDLCNDCITDRIASSDSSLGGSRYFEG